MLSSSRETQLERFRKAIRRQLMEKGVVPPEEDSKREQELYQQWQKGHARLSSKP